jgi:3',5'-cyclic AMP phosphodiesterase CpdA
LRLVQISDTHLSRWDGPLCRNFHILVNFIDTVLRPDLVVHTGDVILSNPDSHDDYAAAKELHRLISAPVRFLPGNHDIGEAYDRTWWATTSDRLARFHDFFNATPWLEWFGDIALVGLNSQIFGSGLPAEEEQWRWLEGIASSIEGHSIVLFQHMSFWTSYSGSDGRPGGIKDIDRDRILRIVGAAQVLGVANGHVHRYRKTWRGESFELWAPSTAFLVHRAESVRIPAGLEQLGVVLYEVEREHLKITFQTTLGLDEVEVGEFAEARLIGEELEQALSSFKAVV